MPLLYLNVLFCIYYCCCTKIS